MPGNDRLKKDGVPSDIAAWNILIAVAATVLILALIGNYIADNYMEPEEAEVGAPS